MLTLILGGARSGKSRHAEALIAANPPPWRYIATAEPGDDEMRARIAAHRARRGAGWHIVESPHDLAGPLATGLPVLVDCLTLWLSNLLLAGRDLTSASDTLLSALASRQTPTVLVSNEVGLGIVPDNALARRFRDEAGRLHQAVGCIADSVILMVAGIPMRVK